MDTGTVIILNVLECEQIVRKSLKLRAGDGIKIITYAVEKASNELVGFMGEYYKLQVRVESENSANAARELCYFLKSVPISNEQHKAECESKDFFGKEGHIYAEILPHIQRYASTKLYPECYYTRHDLLVLEDLAAPQLGYRHLSREERYTNKHRKLFLSHLAQLHAASIAWEEKEGFNIGIKFKDTLFELLLSTQNDWYVTGAKGIIFLAKNYRKFQTTKIQKLINEKLYPLLIDVEKFTEPSKHSRNVFLHRDSWDRNILFKFDENKEPTDCCIVDFQLSRYAPPALDILHFLYGETTAKERALYMKEYLEHYFFELQARLVELQLPADIITKRQFMEECRSAHLPALVVWAICKPLTMMPEGLSNKMRNEEPEKFDYYMNTQRDELFLRMMALDPTYEDKIMWPIEEIIDHLLKNCDILE